MSQITIINPTVEVVAPTPIVVQPLTNTGSGEVGVQTQAFKNDGNVPATISWNVSNVLNGTFKTTGVETASISYKGASGTVVLQPNQTVKFHFFFTVPAGAPGVENLPCTADYAIQWV